MPKLIDIEGMSVDELWQLHESIGRMLSARLTVEKRALEKQLAHLRRERGPTGADSANSTAQTQTTGGARRKYPRVYPKYRNSEEPFQTWSGRGRQPLWLTAALREGHALDEFIIRNPGPETSTVTRKRS